MLQQAKKNWFNKQHVLNALFFVLLLVILFVPGIRSLFTRGLMAVGFFKPEVAQQDKPINVPDVTFTDSNGKNISLSALKGKVVFINFWATWCPPCLAELPSINALHQQLKADPNVVFLIVDADNDLRKSVPFIANKGYNLPVYGTVSHVPQQMLTGTIPTTLVINKQGQMVFHHQGVANYGDDRFENYLHILAGE